MTITTITAKTPAAPLMTANVEVINGGNVYVGSITTKTSHTAISAAKKKAKLYSAVGK
jgi:hypothetical protein